MAVSLLLVVTSVIVQAGVLETLPVERLNHKTFANIFTLVLKQRRRSVNVAAAVEIVGCPEESLI
jgi:hypothetical protein